jgi:cell wall-associated NlpC family hydrolase
MVAPAWCEPFTRLEYEDKGRGPVKFDCWGFVLHVQRSRFGRTDLPDLTEEYPSAEDHLTVASVVRKYEEALSDMWVRVKQPTPGDIVIIKIKNQPWHCGVCVGGDWMMHILKGVNVGLERFTHATWRNRIEGFYRHV